MSTDNRTTAIHKFLAAITTAVILSFGLGTVSQSALAQGSTDNTAGSTTQSTAGGPVDASSGNSSPTTSTSGDVNDMGPGTSSDIYGNYLKRMRSAANFSATQYGGSDVIQNGQSLGPGTVVNSSSGPVQVWPAMVPTAVSTVPTFRDQAISKNLFQTFGYPVSDTQFQVISRYNDNILLEQMFSPERAMWMANAIGNIQGTKTANNTANLAQNQATSAIEHIEVFLTNFTNEAADPGDMWHQLLNNLFIPMAILLLLVGAVVAQVVAIAAQGTSVLGNISPFDGLQRSVIAVFLIPFTQLIMSWGIDVANSISLSIPTAYYTQFGRDMYQDAICAQKKAFPVQQANNNLNAIIPYTATNSGTNGTIEGMDFDILGGWNPCQNALPTAGTNVVPDEAEQFVMTSSRLMCNMGNSTLAITWNVLCAFQTAYLYYLWCMGPIVAALWVWPMQQLRNALPSWIDGLITLCFWSLFWNTSVLLMACFYGINTNGDTGTMYMSALNLLANLSVKFAFNFSGLTTSLGFMAESMMMQAASGGGAGGAGGGQRGGAGAGAGAGHFGAGAAGHFGAGGGHFGHGVGTAAFVPGQGQPGTETAGTMAGAGTAAGATGAGAVGAGGLATTMGGTTGFGAGTDTTAGGALTGTGFGTGLGGAASSEVGMPGASGYLAGSGNYETGGAIGAISPALSGTAAPGAFDVASASGSAGLGAMASAAGSVSAGELGNPGVSPIEPGAVTAGAGLTAAGAAEFNPAAGTPIDVTGAAVGGAGISGSAEVTAGQLTPGGSAFVTPNDMVPGGTTGATGLNIPGDSSLVPTGTANPNDPLSGNNLGLSSPPLTGEQSTALQGDLSNPNLSFDPNAAGLSPGVAASGDLSAPPALSESQAPVSVGDNLNYNPPVFDTAASAASSPVPMGDNLNYNPAVFDTAASAASSPVPMDDNLNYNPAVFDTAASAASSPVPMGDNLNYNPAVFDTAASAASSPAQFDTAASAVSGPIPAGDNYNYNPAVFDTASFAAQAPSTNFDTTNVMPAPAPDAGSTSSTNQYEVGGAWSAAPAQPPAVTFSDQGLTAQMPVNSGDVNYNLGAAAPPPDAGSMLYNTTVYPDSGASTNNINSDYSYFNQTPVSPNVGGDPSATAFNTPSSDPGASGMGTYNPPAAPPPDASSLSMTPYPDSGVTNNLSNDYSYFQSTQPSQTVFDNASAPASTPIAQPDITYDQNNYIASPTPAPTPDQVAPTPVFAPAPDQQVAFADVPPPVAPTPMPIEPPIVILPIGSAPSPEPVFASPPEPVIVQPQQPQVVEAVPQEQIIPPAPAAPPQQPTPVQINPPQQPPFAAVAMTPPPPPSSATPTPAPQHEEEVETAQTQRSSLQEILAGLALRKRYRKQKPGSPDDEPPPPSSLV